ncbi:hypothetical protein [Azovibrio restrictus]|uniref:hypothetical protein n=1 Tax=Azovibrio restrictus TaxID=146938 RepID=UPI0026F12F3D|nr:hypothetical protein [Azovibrio restrictus]MDD3481817.1 hypothetical protein [Azovibrio restrictus]
MLDNEDKPGIASYAQRLKAIGPAGGLTVRPDAATAPQAPQQSPGIPTLQGLSKTFAPGGSASSQVHPASAGITVDPSNLNPAQRSAAAFAYSQGVDRATGTGPGPGALSARQGIDMGIMAKRFDAYQKDPNALAMANARENMLGSGISMTHGPAGGLTITSNGIGKDALPAAGGSGINMNEANAVLARANATRQGMIDSAAPRSGGGSVGVIDSPSAAAGRDDSMIRDLYDATKKGTRSERANATLLLNNLLNQRNAAAMGKERMGHEGSLAQQRFALEQGALMARQGIDMARFGMEQKAHESQMEDAGFARLARQGLMAAANSTDPEEKNRSHMMAVAAGVLKPQDRKLQTLQTDNGVMVFDPGTGRMVPAVGPDGQPLGSGKPLTEYQGKSTGFGMRADAASRLIDSVGQGGKVQPSLLKRAAESVPLVGEGLGMVANRFASPEQQQVEQAQRDFINAVLRQESGAAISQSEFENSARQYFPQPGDSAEVIEQKRANREAAINGFRISAGPGAKHIGSASAPAPAGQTAQQPQQGPQGAGSLAAGHVDEGHVFLGGNPNDPANWMEVRK